MSTRTIDIKSQSGGYSVEFLPTLSACLKACESPNAFFLIDQRVFELYKTDFSTLPAGKIVTWEATEENKTFASLEKLFEKLLAAGLKKGSQLVVVGGGILQDAGGFVASTIYRGITWHLIPTTLLAQSDSCIGAKTSVNLRHAKNILGSFSAPRRVLLTTSVLKTLTPGDVKSGLAEAVKLGIVHGSESVSWMKEHLPKALEGSFLEEFLFRSLEIKKKYIEEDEFDKGIRNLLNVGHTFGHAFEFKTGFQIPHGVAVGLGMRAAAYFSVEKGFADGSFADDIDGLMKPLTDDAIPVLKRYSATDYVEIMKSDKKNVSQDITFILGRGHGKLFKHQLPVSDAETLLTRFLQTI